MPADLLLINVHQKSGFFDTVNLDGEAVLSEKYAVAENVFWADLQSMSITVAFDKPNPNLTSFSGEVSFDKGPFIEVSSQNLALRGSVLRSTNFVIGVALYVGSDTKAHMSSKVQV